MNKFPDWSSVSNTNTPLLTVKGDFTPLKEFGHVTAQMIMPIVAILDGEIVPQGTGFVISPDGFLITAKHVLEGFANPKIKRRDGKGFYREYSLNSLYTSNVKHGDKNQFYLGGLLPIERVWFSNESDIAFCWIRIPTLNDAPLKLPSVKLSPGIPKIGEHILGFGYYKSNGSVIVNNKCSLEQNTAFTQGVINEVYPLKRDSCMLNFPCFRTSARFEAGMSGGPIFNEKGSVCGVICSSGLEDDNGYISYSSLLWSAMGTMLEVSLKIGDPVQFITFYDLVKRGHMITDDSINDINVVLNQDGTKSISVKDNNQS